MGSWPSLHDMESVWNAATNPQLYSLCAKTPTYNSLLDLYEVACFSKTRMHPHSHHLSNLKRIAGFEKQAEL